MKEYTLRGYMFISHYMIRKLRHYMRGLRRSVFPLFMIFVVLGCSERLDFPETKNRGGGLVFSVSVLEADVLRTRSFSSEGISSLHLLVFDEQGFFVECREAEPVEPDAFGTDMNTEYRFRATLQASPNPRIIHLVANYDFDSSPVSYGTEYYVMRQLTVSDGQDAYWQRIVLEDGIPESLDEMSEEGLSRITKIPLVRNFARVDVSSRTDDFEISGYALWNVPDRGCVAPCVMSVNSFAAYETTDSAGDGFGNNPWASRSYAELSSSYDGVSDVGFGGFLPAGTQIVATDAASLTYDMSVKHLYERPFSNDETNTAIIVRGSYAGHPDTYYKIDFVRSGTAGVAEYYNILRNFIYSASIISCTSDGYPTAAEAAAAPASNNFISSVVTQDIINISEGSSRLYVSYTDTTVVSSSDFSFRYRYIPDWRDAPTVADNGDILTFDRSTERPLTAGGTVIRSWTSEDSSDGWRHVTISPQLPEDEEKSQTVIFYDPGSNMNVKIARSVTFRVRNPYTFRFRCPATVQSGLSRQFTLNILLPTGLRESLFPLDFRIESEDNSIAPNASLSDDEWRSGYMSTWYGESMINSGKRSFGFTKSLTYGDYMSMASTSDNSHKIVPCAFLTTKSASATTVWVQNKYFEFGDGLSTVTFSN